jgi:hypothetical protein
MRLLARLLHSKRQVDHSDYQKYDEFEEKDAFDFYLWLFLDLFLHFRHVTIVVNKRRWQQYSTIYIYLRHAFPFAVCCWHYWNRLSVRHRYIFLEWYKKTNFMFVILETLQKPRPSAIITSNYYTLRREWFSVFIFYFIFSKKTKNNDHHYYHYRCLEHLIVFWLIKQPAKIFHSILI